MSGLAHGTGSTASSPLQGYSNTFSDSPSQNRLYAASAPSSSTALNRQGSSPGRRPAVPLFSQSTGNIHQSSGTQLFASPVSQGSASTPGPPSPFSLTLTASDMSSADFQFTDFAASVEGAAGGLFDDGMEFPVGGFEPVNSGAPLTVSPKDIMNDMSAPNSTTFTDLTTPGTSYDQSPWMANTGETSPLFSEADLDDDATNWPPLFPPSENITIKTRTASTTSVPQHAAAQGKTSPVAPKMSRNGSSPGQSSSRSGTNTRHSFTSGVNSRRRDKPLPVITVEDPNDTVAVKRARNTMAARKSRAKRMERTEQLEATIAELEDQVDHWKNIAIARGHVE